VPVFGSFPSAKTRFALFLGGVASIFLLSLFSHLLLFITLFCFVIMLLSSVLGARPVLADPLFSLLIVVLSQHGSSRITVRFVPLAPFKPLISHSLWNESIGVLSASVPRENPFSGSCVRAFSPFLYFSFLFIGSTDAFCRVFLRIHPSFESTGRARPLFVAATLFFSHPRAIFSCLSSHLSHRCRVLQLSCVIQY
jgi:hypothetical protein